MTDPKAQLAKHGLEFGPPLLPRGFSNIQQVSKRIAAATLMAGYQRENLIPRKRRSLRRSDLEGFYGIESRGERAVWVQQAQGYGEVIFFDPTDVGPRITVLDWDCDGDAEPINVGCWCEVLVTEGKPVSHTFRWCDSVMGAVMSLHGTKDVDSNNPSISASRELALLAMGQALTSFSEGYKRIGR